MRRGDFTVIITILVFLLPGIVTSRAAMVVPRSPSRVREVLGFFIAYLALIVAVPTVMIWLRP